MKLIRTSENVLIHLNLFSKVIISAYYSEGYVECCFYEWTGNLVNNTSTTLIMLAVKEDCSDIDVENVKEELENYLMNYILVFVESDKRVLDLKSEQFLNDILCRFTYLKLRGTK
ncbi:hypothetical protein NCTC12673_gp134 [Campylobacter phage NCTC12673]|uniref:Uncharacterized protein n=2 Tax=Fletchervirus NCTC12673 TaxID=934027 RepID=A0A1B0XW20_9CAUD|nr:hypothetical protein NCTC12673_gp134 [Campylobacter phage NCTC12673]YP_009321619.1 hypothetical protein BOX06_gp020 [Campylobacter phage PC14]AEA86477.1 hypothetical protein [Campylobacter phage NCTC12673]ANH51313.1 hypothetical protein PC14_00020 [Campylobacter phage PC14]